MFIFKLVKMTELTERLRYLMREEGMKQKDLAEIVGTSPQTVNNWLKRGTLSRESAQAINEKRVIHWTGCSTALASRNRKAVISRPPACMLPSGRALIMMMTNLWRFHCWVSGYRPEGRI